MTDIALFELLAGWRQVLPAREDMASATIWDK